VATAVQGWVDVIRTLFPETAKVIGDLISGFGTWFSDLANRMIEWGGNIIDGLVKGIKAAPEAVWNALKSVVLRGVENIRAFLGIASPSKLFMEMGGFVSEGMALGITAGLPKVDAAMAEMGRRMALNITPRAEVSDELLTTGPLDTLFGKLEKVGEGLGGVAAGAKVQTVQIAESIRDMADKSIQALDRMVSAIKGGDFLDILGSLINLGLQLGSMGVFGKKVQTSINAPQLPGFATGGSFTVGGRPGRDANVVAFRATRGEHVQISTSEAAAINRAGAYPVPGAPMNITVTPSPYFDVAVDGRIVQAAPSVAGAGAALAQSQMEQRARRRVR
jgi:hypothetical protein